MGAGGGAASPSGRGAEPARGSPRHLALFAAHPHAHPSSNAYFTHAEWNKGWPDSYIGALDQPTEQQAPKHERLWTLSDVFGALTEAGLSVTYLGEHPDEYWDAFPKLSADEKANIPMTFSMIVRKP